MCLALQIQHCTYTTGNRKYKISTFNNQLSHAPSRPLVRERGERRGERGERGWDRLARTVDNLQGMIDTTNVEGNDRNNDHGINIH